MSNPSDLKRVYGALVSAYWYVPDPQTQMHGTGEQLNLLVALLEKEQKMTDQHRRKIADLDKLYSECVQIYNPASGGNRKSIILMHQIRQDVLRIAIAENLIVIDTGSLPRLSDIVGQDQRDDAA